MGSPQRRTWWWGGARKKTVVKRARAMTMTRDGLRDQTPHCCTRWSRRSLSCSDLGVIGGNSTWQLVEAPGSGSAKDLRLTQSSSGQANRKLQDHNHEKKCDCTSVLRTAMTFIEPSRRSTGPTKPIPFHPSDPEALRTSEALRAHELEVHLDRAFECATAVLERRAMSNVVNNVIEGTRRLLPL